MTPESMCIRCMKVKPRTAAMWRVRKSCRDGLEPHVCRVCRNAQTRHEEQLERDGVKPERVPGNICPDCANLPHRVQGKRCITCRLERAEEPRPELQFRKAVP
jgi:hypothetical protein